MTDPKHWFRAAEPLTYTTRADELETVHGGHCSVVDGATGREVLSLGDPSLTAFPRSSLKFIQGLAMVETGAADAFALDQRHLSLGCASHFGETGHVELVRSWLRHIKCEESDLVCGPAFPMLEGDRDAAVAAGQAKSRSHHNCSGKHTGFLTVCQHQGWTTEDYDDPAHPSQRRFQGVLAELTGLEQSDIGWGIDGCALPTATLPVTSMARALASFAVAQNDTARGQAQLRLLDAVAAQPWYLAGTADFAPELARVTQGRIVAKGGADGYFVAAIRDKGWGLALKTLDGSTVVVAAALYGVLNRLNLLSEDEKTALAPFALKPVLNSSGTEVGHWYTVS